MSASRCALIAAAALIGAAASALSAQEPATPPRWAWSGAVSQYFLPDDPDFAIGVGTADRANFHLEGRWNYESVRAASFFAGRTFTVDRAVEIEATPMLGAVVGTVVGVAPGLELSASFGPLEFYTETEYVQDLRNQDDSFFYTWSELGVRLAAPLTAGLVGQRLRVVESPLGLDRGPYVRLETGRLSITGYLFNIGTDSRFAVCSLGAEF